ncbi:hypothetical protein HK101_010038, partial [Irineochytrium annulatum]
MDGAMMGGIVKGTLWITAAVTVAAVGYYSSLQVSIAKQEKDTEIASRALFAAAVRREDFVQFRELLQKFIRSDPRDAEGNTPFMVACHHGNHDVIRYFLSMHPATSDIKRSPLFLAANDFGHTAVHVTALANSVDTLRTLLGSNSILALAMISVRTVGRLRSSLHLVVLEAGRVNGVDGLLEGNGEDAWIAMVEALIKLHADVNCVDCQKTTPLMIAAKQGNVAIVERLLKANADTTLLDVHRHSALFYAVASRQHRIARMILEHAKAKKEKGPSPTLATRANSARRAGTVARLSPAKQLNGAATAAKAQVSGGVSMSRSGSSSGSSVPVVPEKPESQNIPDWRGYTPLLLAAKDGDKEMVEMLMEFGADVTKVTRKGETILHLAVASGSLDVVLRLLQVPTLDTHRHDCKGITVFHLAAIDHRPDILSPLLTHPTSVPNSLSLIDNQAHTPLHSSCLPPRTPTPEDLLVSTAQLLLNNACPADALDADGNTALDLARLHSLDKVVTLLALHGATLPPSPPPPYRPPRRANTSSSSLNETDVNPPLTIASRRRRRALENTRIPLDVRQRCLNADVSLAGVAAKIEEGEWRTRNRFDKPNPFKAVVVLGPRAGSTVLTFGPAQARAVGLEPLKRETLRANPREFFKVLRRSYLPLRRRKLASGAAHALVVQMEGMGILGRVVTANVDGMDTVALGITDALELRGGVRTPPVSAPGTPTTPGASPSSATPPGAVGPAMEAERFWGLVESDDVVKCERVGCVSGLVHPGLRFDDDEEGEEEAAFWEVVDGDVAGCSLFVVVGATMHPGSRLETLCEAVPPHVPRLLIDTELSGPFLDINYTGKVELASGEEADVSVDAGGNYRDVAVIFEESAGGISKGVGELARA